MNNHQRALLFLPYALVCACQANESTNHQTYPEDSAIYPALDEDETRRPDPTSNPWTDGLGEEGSSNATTEAQMPGSDSGNMDEQNESGAAQNGATSAGEGVATTNSDETEEFNPEVDEQERGVPSVILSEYKEGLGSDKRLALVNLGETTPLSCRIEVYVNGGTTPWRKITVSHELAPGQGPVVLCSETEANSSCMGSVSGSYFNGNDALLVICDDIVMDSFGQIGFDPGAAWTDINRTISSKDMDLIRCDQRPDTDASNAFFIEAQWIKREAGEPLEAALLRCPTAPGLGGSGNGD